MKDFEEFSKAINNYIDFGKLPKDQKLGSLIQSMEDLDREQKTQIQSKLQQLKHEILNPDPTSFTPCILHVLKYGTTALKRACIMSFLVMASSYNYCSIKTSLTAGVLTGITMFSASYLYDSAQANIKKKLQRFSEINNKLREYNLPSDNASSFGLKWSHKVV